MERKPRRLDPNPPNTKARDYDRDVLGEPPEPRGPRERVFSLEFWQPPTRPLPEEPEPERTVRRAIGPILQEVGHRLPSAQRRLLASAAGTHLLAGSLLGDLLDSGELPETELPGGILGPKDLLQHVHAVDFLRLLGERSEKEARDRDLEAVRWNIQALATERAEHARLVHQLEAVAAHDGGGVPASQVDLETEPLPALRAVEQWLLGRERDVRVAEDILRAQGYRWDPEAAATRPVGKGGRPGGGGPLLRPLVAILLPAWEKAEHEGRPVLSAGGARDAGALGVFTRELRPFGFEDEVLRPSHGSALWKAVENTIKGRNEKRSQK